MNTRLFGLFAVCILLLAACAPGVSSEVAEIPELPPYDGPQAKVVVGSFECSARNCSGGIGRGVADGMVTALVQSNRYQVIEAAGNLGVLQNELDVTGDASAFEGSDLAIIGTITQFEPNASGTSGSAGVGRWFNRLTGGAQVRRATATVDLRIVDVRTRAIVAVTRVTGEATSTSLSARRSRYFTLAGGALSQYANTSMETALQDMIYTAVIDIGDRIPQEYYQY